MNFIARLLDLVSPFNAESVTKRIDRDVKRLRKVADNRRHAAENFVTAATDLLTEAREHASHAAHAERVAERLSKLLD
jgi:hypothetical protein